MCVGNIIGDVVGGIFGLNSADKQADAAKAAARDAAAAQKYSVDQQINYLNQGATAAQGLLQPLIDDGTATNPLLKGAYNIGTPADLAAYNTSYDGSHFKTEADYNTAKAHQALISTNAAMGRGGAINSGKALRAAGDQAYELAMQGRAGHLVGLQGYVDRGDAARQGLANIRIGQAGQVANAFANQGNALASIYANRGNQLVDAAASGGLAIQNALGGISGQLANGGFNWNTATKSIGNAFGYNPPRTPVTSVVGSKGPGKI